MLLTPNTELEFQLNKFIDFDKDNKIFYNNLYLKDFDIVIKMPLTAQNKLPKEMIIEKFNLTKCSYLLSYE